MQNQPLADRLRPKTLDDMVGQRHLIGEHGILRRLLDAGRFTNMIFSGPPGTGKTTAANIIAMTFVLPLTDRDFSRALWKSATECPVVFPGGVGVVPWMVPGGADIALATCQKMEEFDAAVWAHHGLFASGPDFDITFGLMHTIEKAAEIWVLQKSTGLPELQTIQDDELRAIARDFKVQLR